MDRVDVAGEQTDQRDDVGAAPPAVGERLGEADGPAQHHCAPKPGIEDVELGVLAPGIRAAEHHELAAVVDHQLAEQAREARSHRAGKQARFESGALVHVAALPMLPATANALRTASS